MFPCVNDTAHKASILEDHEPKWESTDRRAFVSKKLRDSITDQILNRKDEKEMHHRTHEEIVNEFKRIMKIPENESFKYKKIIFSGPATIILWKDGTKTVVKCSPGRFCDPYSGVAIAFMKKALGNKSGHRNKKIMNDIYDALNAMKKKEEKNGETENS